MPESRCEKTDLPTSMCAHCLGHREEPAIPAEDFADRPSFAARYEGRCNCGEPFHPGDQIRMAAVGWIANCCRP
jgi:hypothetical protein